MIVVVIIWILIWIGTLRLSSLDADKYYSESCVNTLYAPISEWVYWASTSKILSWDVISDYYHIKKLDQNSGFLLQYQDENSQLITYKTGILSEIPYCQKGEKYRVSVHFDFDEIRMLPGLMSRGHQNGFEILQKDGTPLATGAISFGFCSPSSLLLSTDCREFWEIVFDARTAMVRKRFCKLYFPKDKNDSSKKNKCRERSSGQ